MVALVAIVGVLLSAVISALSGALIARARRAERRATRGELRLAQDLSDTATARDQAEERVQLLAALAERAQQLLDAQIERLVALEREAVAPADLDALVELDHLAVQARRTAEAALVAAGRANPRRWSRPVPLGDVARAAVAEVDGYHRVQLRSSADELALHGDAVADVSHVLAEIIDAAFDRVRGDDVVTVQRDGATISVRPAVPVGELVELLARRHGISVAAGPNATVIELPADLVVDRQAPTPPASVEPTLDLADPPAPSPALAPAAAAPEVSVADAAWPLRAVPEQVIRSMSR